MWVYFMRIILIMTTISRNRPGIVASYNLNKHLYYELRKRTWYTIGTIFRKDFIFTRHFKSSLVLIWWTSPRFRLLLSCPLPFYLPASLTSLRMYNTYKTEYVHIIPFLIGTRLSDSFGFQASLNMFPRQINLTTEHDVIRPDPQR